MSSETDPAKKRPVALSNWGESASALAWRIWGEGYCAVSKKMWVSVKKGKRV
jgi:hypothetical protein